MACRKHTTEEIERIIHQLTNALEKRNLSKADRQFLNDLRKYNGRSVLSTFVSDILQAADVIQTNQVIPSATIDMAIIAEPAIHFIAKIDEEDFGTFFKETVKITLEAKKEWHNSSRRIRTTTSLIRYYLKLLGITEEETKKLASYIGKNLWYQADFQFHDAAQELLAPTANTLAAVIVAIEKLDQLEEDPQKVLSKLASSLSKRSRGDMPSLSTKSSIAIAMAKKCRQ